MRLIAYLLVFTSLIQACDKDDASSRNEHKFDFSDGPQGWNAYFSDYPVGREEFYELAFAHTRLPEPLDTTLPALMISGNNHSDDLVSMIYRKFAGLQANHTYSVKFNIDVASNVATNSFGIGGSPDLALGAGGISFSPGSNVDEEGLYRPNFTSLLQSRLSNDTLRMLGTIGVNDTTTEYALINRNNLNDPIRLTTNNKGELWLLIGTDSGFEGPTTLFFRKIDIEIK